MFTKTIAAAALAVFLGSASTALAQYASPGPTYGTNYVYGPNGYDTWSTDRGAQHRRHGVDHTNGW